MKNHSDHSCHAESPHGRNNMAAAFKRPAVMVLAGFVLLLGLSFVFKGLVPFRQEFLMYFRSIWWAILIGLLMSGLVDFFIPDHLVSHLLAGNNKRSIFRAVLCGFLMSACSHGILALAIQLYKKGASVPAVIALLLASPWANLPLTFILIGFFGAKAFFLIFSAIVIAVVTGFIYQGLENRRWVESNPYTAAGEENVLLSAEIKRKLSAGIVHATTQVFKSAAVLADMVMWWMLIGMGLASLAAAYVPEAWFIQYMGPHLGGILVTLVFATVLEVCSEGTAPLAFEIFRRTGGFGNALVFLLAGVATDYTEIGLLWSNVGRKAAVWLPVITVPQIIIFGVLANSLF
ncbi:MAG: permease [Candidatus Omnitrophica bacterium]|nr:permease [Candidatus Omnitrophota bacterium]